MPTSNNQQRYQPEFRDLLIAARAVIRHIQSIAWSIGIRYYLRIKLNSLRNSDRKRLPIQFRLDAIRPIRPTHMSASLGLNWIFKEGSEMLECKIDEVGEQLARDF